MKSLDTGQDKIQEICDLLRKETIEPARHESDAILVEAKKEAAGIVAGAKVEAELLLNGAREKIQKEKAVFDSALGQGCKQSLEALRQLIEDNFFSPELDALIVEKTKGVDVIAKMIEALIESVGDEGNDLSAIIPKDADASGVAKQLSKRVIDRLREGEVVVGDFGGGVRVKLHDQKITLDLSDDAIKEQLARYVRKDLRQLIFQAV